MSPRHHLMYIGEGGAPRVSGDEPVVEDGRFAHPECSPRECEGIARAKARGAYKGRAKVLTDAQVAQARGWVADGVPKAEVARRLGIGRTTLYKYLAGSAG